MISSLAKPSIYVIAGPNGAGKTTFAEQFLPQYVQCTEFLNADLIAWGLSPFAPETQQVRASELMLERIGGLVDKRATFAFETTLAARSYRHRILEWRAIGFYVHLFFLWLPSAEMAVARVANRVRQGGHSVPEQTVRRRYNQGLRNFHELYRPVVDEWTCFDNSQLPPQLIAQSKDQSEDILNKKVWEHIQAHKGGDT